MRGSCCCLAIRTGEDKLMLLPSSQNRREERSIQRGGEELHVAVWQSEQERRSSYCCLTVIKWKGRFSRWDLRFTLLPNSSSRIWDDREWSSTEITQQKRFMFLYSKQNRRFSWYCIAVRAGEEVALHCLVVRSQEIDSVSRLWSGRNFIGNKRLSCGMCFIRKLQHF